MSLTENVEDGVQESVDGDAVPVARPDKVQPVVDEWSGVEGSITLEDGRVQMHDQISGYLSLGTPVPNAIRRDDDPDIMELYHRETDGGDDREATIRLDTTRAVELYQALEKVLRIHGKIP